MIRHQVFFDTLGTLREDSASWRSVFAGLSVLRLVDSYTDNSASVDPANWAQLHSVRSSVEEVSAGDPIRGVLTTVLEETIARGTIDEIVCRSLLGYGRALDYDANWSLAADVYQTVAKISRPEKNAKLAVEANVAVGGAARRNGDWETSARAYSQAAYIADTMGDRQGVLTVQVGIANTYMAKGNLPQAQSILDDVLTQAADLEIREVQSIALHSRAALAHRRGDPAEAVKLAHDALRLSSAHADREGILGDLGAFFGELGMRDAARDSYLLMAATAQTKWVRWQAIINLMELASFDGQETAFDDYTSELRREPLPPLLKSHFLLMLGEGLERFDRYETAAQALSEAKSCADHNQIFSVSFKADEALSALRSKARKAGTQPTFAPLTHDVLAAAHDISELRKAAVATG
ncbi:MAG: tetratricopeptide repeat protein [Gemmatimonadaceae bacterium]